MTNQNTRPKAKITVKIGGLHCTYHYTSSSVKFVSELLCRISYINPDTNLAFKQILIGTKGYGYSDLAAMYEACNYFLNGGYFAESSIEDVPSGCDIGTEVESIEFLLDGDRLRIFKSAFDKMGINKVLRDFNLTYNPKP